MMIKVEEFSGAVEKVSPRLLDAKFATKAVNCRVDRGSLAPVRLPETVGTLPLAAKTIYRYTANDWLTWDEDVDVARSPVAYDVTDRVYFTGTGYPKQTRNDIALGTAILPANSYRVGVPAPGVCALSVTGAPDPEQAGLESTVYYASTFVTAWGEEGPPSLPSAAAVITDGQEVTVTLPSVPTGNYNFGDGALRRVYRSNSGTSDTAFQFLAELPITTGAFLDTTPADALGEVIPTTLWDAPPDDDLTRYPTGEMRGIRTLPSGAMVGFSGNTLVYSEPYLPHAWPYSYPLKDPIVAIEVTTTGVLVTTTDKPVLAVGLDPRAVAIQELDERRACVSKRSMVDMGEYAVYASPDGLVGIENGSIRLLTESIFTREQWQRFIPASINAFRWEGKYVGFYSDGVTSGGFVLDLANGSFVELDFFADAGYYDASEDTLYLANGTDLVKFDAGLLAEYEWQSKLFQLPRPTSFSVLQVVADSYPVEVEVTRDGVGHVYSVSSDRPARLISGRGHNWQFVVRGNATVHSVALAQSVQEVANG